MFDIKKILVKDAANDDVFVDVDVNGTLVRTEIWSDHRIEFGDMLPFEEAYVLDHMVDAICHWWNNGGTTKEGIAIIPDLEHDEEDTEWETLCLPVE